MVSSGYGCHPDEKDFTCKFMHPHGHTENNYVTCQYGDYWWLALVMDVIQMRRTSLVSLASTWPHREQLCHLSIWGLLVVSSGYGCHPERTSLVSLCIHMATQRTTMSPVNMETTGG